MNLPVGNYGSSATSISLLGSGVSGDCALTGLDINAHLSSFFNKDRTVGMALLLGYSNNPFDFNGFFKGQAYFYSRLYGENITLNSYSASSYNLYRIMLGLAIALPIGKVTLDFNFLTGPDIVSYSGANYNYTITAINQDVAAQINNNSVTRLGIALRVGARYPITSKLSLLLSGNWNNAFSNAYSGFSVAVGGLRYYTFGNFSVMTINITGGIAYEFGKYK